MSASENAESLEKLAAATRDAADEAVDTLPSSGLLSFYDHLRDRIHEAVERRGGRLGSHTAEALLLIPDIFILILRLSLDREVPKATRALMASSLVYFVLPTDFLPELIIGAGGFLDDLVLGVAVVAHAFNDDLEPYIEKYWSGSRQLRVVLRDILEAAHGLVGHRVYDNLRSLLEKRGIPVENKST